MKLQKDKMYLSYCKSTKIETKQTSELLVRNLLSNLGVILQRIFKLFRIEKKETKE
jgi:hypothetical protein